MATAPLEKEIGHGNAGLIPWSAFFDVIEPVPELAWPLSVTTYSAMRTVAQVASLLLAFTLPIRRYGWYVDPNGARDEVVQFVATRRGTKAVMPPPHIDHRDLSTVLMEKE